MPRKTIIPVPFSMSPYGDGNDKTYKKILKISAANENMQETFPSNLLLDNCTINEEVEFNINKDSHPEGLFLESARSMQLNLSKAVAKQLPNSDQLLILGGDHTISIGTGLGLSKHIDLSKVGLIWVDAHADSNTAKTSLSKSLTGYPVAINCGVGPDKLIQDFSSNIQNVAYIGLRDVDKGELENIKHTDPLIFSNLDIEDLSLKVIIDKILHKFQDLEHIWLSIDIDSLDPVYFQAGETDVPVTGGLTPRELLYITSRIAQTNKLKITELVQLNDINQDTPLLVLASRISEIALNIGGYRYGKK